VEGQAAQPWPGHNGQLWGGECALVLRYVTGQCPLRGIWGEILAVVLHNMLDTGGSTAAAALTTFCTVVRVRVMWKWGCTYEILSGLEDRSTSWTAALWSR
jgi:hypothetical protein